MKRFTETEKWRDPWFRRLSPKHKLLWAWLCDMCDSAGIIDIDFDLAGFQIGTSVKVEDVAAFGDRVRPLPNGKWFLAKFVAYQYGQLSPACKPHQAVLRSLEANGIVDGVAPKCSLEHQEEGESVRVPKGYPKGMERVQEKDKDKDKDKDKVEEGAGRRRDRGTLDEIVAFAAEIGLQPTDGEFMFHKWVGCGWANGGKPIKDWKATLRSWKAAGYLPSQKAATQPSLPFARGNQSNHNLQHIHDEL